jgi:hypothetical protein
MYNEPKGQIYSKGYGIIPKAVMCDKNLSATAKAIYAYLCSYTCGNNSEIEFPSVQSIMSDLGITEVTYNKYRAELVKSGYITIIITTVGNGMYYKNDYIIEANPSINTLNKPMKILTPRRKIPGNHRIAVLNRDQSTCRLCGAKAPDVQIHIDHIIPLSEEGSDEIENLQCLCAQCNREKSDRFELHININ